MEKKNQIPKYPHLRFSEFTDEWKEYQNSEVFEIISEKNTDLRYSNVVSASMNHGVVLRDEIGIDIKYEQENIRGYKVVRDGDYIVHLRSFQGGFAFSRLNGICSPAYTILRPQPNMLEYGFLESYFYSSRFITSLKQVTYGIRDGRSISIGEWMQEKTSLPTLPEQRKIAALLSLIDERIEVQNAIIKEQEVAKTSLIRRLFDRTLRFPEFTDEWKEVKLGEICPSIQSGKDKKEEGEIPLYGAAKQLAYTRSASYSPPLILIGRVGSVGQLQWIDIPCGVSDNALVIQKGEGEAETVDIRFLFYCLKMAHLEQYAGGSSQKVITASFLKSLPLHLPLLPEQRKIADLLSAVDERITVEKEYATLLQKQKAYLLRQMFV